MRDPKSTRAKTYLGAHFVDCQFYVFLVTRWADALFSHADRANSKARFGLESLVVTSCLFRRCWHLAVGQHVSDHLQMQTDLPVWVSDPRFVRLPDLGVCWRKAYRRDKITQVIIMSQIE